MRPFQLQQQAKRATQAFDSEGLHAAISLQQPIAQTLQQAVASRVHAMPYEDHTITDVHREINNILLQETCRLFPPQQKPDRRISADPGYRASATQTWALYRAMKAPGPATLANIWSKWRALAAFQRASKALRQQSKQLKVEFHQAQLEQAEDAEGHLLTEQQELQAVLLFGKETFASLPDDLPHIATHQDLVFDAVDIWWELTRLPTRKAVPSHIAPNIVWSHCAEVVYEPLSEALNHHFKAGSPDRLDEDMKAVTLLLADTASNRFTRNANMQAVPSLPKDTAAEPSGDSATATVQGDCIYSMSRTTADLEASIFAHCMPSGMTPPQPSGTTNALEPAAPDFQPSGKRLRGQGQGWQRPTYHHQQYHSHWQQPSPPYMQGTGNAMDQQVEILSKLVLKHEEALADVRKDMGFVLFFRQDSKSLLPNLMEVARTWREKMANPAQEPSMTSPLRTVLVNCLLKELLQRAQKVVATEAGRADLHQMGWINAQGHWTYQKWSSSQRKLVINENRAALTHDDMIRHLTELQEHMTGEIIHRFQSKKAMWRIEDEGHQQATFDLHISLRSAVADEVHQSFCVLMGNAITNLVGMSMKRDDRQKQPFAQQLAQMVYPGTASSNGHGMLSSGGDGGLNDQLQTRFKLIQQQQVTPAKIVKRVINLHQLDD
ncbi:unnamed protein product [Symbiodinium sp. CCMP2592]|nr:unnamed protein product [Symbiodinium sp. CCMP2592]